MSGFVIYISLCRVLTAVLRFLHASLQLEALSECISAKEVRQTLKAFPSKIEDVYLFTWNRILKQNAEHVLLAKSVIIWVLNASRSMTVEELRMAVATSPVTHKFEADQLVPSTTLVSLCRGLVTVEEGSRLVRLVRECFSKTRSCLFSSTGYQITQRKTFCKAFSRHPFLAHSPCSPPSA